MFSKTYSTFSYINNIILIDTAVGGDLREYLGGLANCENMPKYVEEHPFGQSRIDETSPSWNLYLQIIASHSACESAENVSMKT
ncbi:hypothetical protein RIF29_19229 [Crotalaria pallida]|uniref:Uncharacterized protein n=1 Tax=Crotalaria pallida TaxID=3830 RepID=A0AAN9F3I0_CROPI